MNIYLEFLSIFLEFLSNTQSFTKSHSFFFSTSTPSTSHPSTPAQHLMTKKIPNEIPRTGEYSPMNGYLKNDGIEVNFAMKTKNNTF